MTRMTFTLSVVRPPEEEAKYGKATVYTGQLNRLRAANRGADVLIEAGVPEKEARDFAAYQLWRPEVVPFIQHEGTGISFRVDPEEDAPHPCPCCGRLVLVTDHAYAHDEDAFCPGCFTWDRNTPACLPENSAHAQSGE